MIKKETFKGLFFLPEAPDEEVAGELMFDFENNIRLELYGSFLNEPKQFMEDKKQEAIWGYLFNGTKISLINCHATNKALNFGGYLIATYNAQVIFKGIHVKDINEEVFFELYAELDHLDEWLDINGSRVQFSEDFKNINLEYTKPEEIKYQIDDQFTCSFVFSHSLPIGGREFNLEPKSFFKLNSNKACSFEKFTSTLWKFQTLLSFFTLSKVRIKALSLYSEWEKQVTTDNKSVHHAIEIYYPQAVTSFDEADKHDYLLDYGDLEILFGVILQKWFVIEQDFNPIIQILYNHLGKLTQFNETVFLNIVQGVEAYHRRYIQNTQQLRQANKEWLSDIFKEVSSKDHIKWLTEKLAFSYEPSLKMRLTELFKVASDELFLNHTQEEITKIIRKIVDTRNYYTHYGAELERKKSNSGEMVMFSKILRNILIVNILKSLNITDELMKIAIKDKMKFSFKKQS